MGSKFSDLEIALSAKIKDESDIKCCNTCDNLHPKATLCLTFFSVITAIAVIITCTCDLIMNQPMIACKHAVSHYAADAVIICVLFLFLLTLILAFLLQRHKTIGENNKRIMKYQETYLSLYYDVMKKRITECEKGNENDIIKNLNEQIKDLQKNSEIGFAMSKNDVKEVFMNALNANTSLIANT